MASLITLQRRYSIIISYIHINYIKIIINYFDNRKGMNRSTRGSRRSPLWKDIFKTGRARNKPNENQSSNKLALPQELEDIMKNKKVIYAYYYMAIIII